MRKVKKFEEEEIQLKNPRTNIRLVIIMKKLPGLKEHIEGLGQGTMLKFFPRFTDVSRGGFNWKSEFQGQVVAVNGNTIAMYDINTERNFWQPVMQGGLTDLESIEYELES